MQKSIGTITQLTTLYTGLVFGEYYIVLLCCIEEMLDETRGDGSDCK